MRISIAVCALSISTLVACNNATSENKTETQQTTAAAPQAAPASVLGEAGTAKLVTLVKGYYALKDAFVASDAAQAVTTATALQAAADSLLPALNDTAKGLDTNLQKIKMAAAEIVAQPTDVEKQRMPFEKVSDAIYALAKQANLKNMNIYRQYCPMAFDDKGAYWLSPEEAIRNPYFGKKMMTCGEVTDSLK